MFSWLKKHFIPHEGNDHRPHVLRDYSIRNFLGIILFLEIFTFLVPIINHINIIGNMAAVLPSVLTDLTNQERQDQSLPTLTTSPLLNEAAQMKATDMATNGYFAHTSPDGKTPWYWLEQVGYNYQYAGENLAINFSDSKDVTAAWMASPTHKANIVKENYTEIGTGVATGLYQGQQTVFVAQLYANPLPAKELIVQNKPLKTEVKKIKEVNNVVAIKNSTNVLGAETVVSTENTQSIPVLTIKYPTFWQKLIASPRHTTDFIFSIISGVIFITLFLYIFIKRKNYHIDLITNGLVILVVIGAIFVTNYYFSYHTMVVDKSIDYSSENK